MIATHVPRDASAHNKTGMDVFVEHDIPSSNILTKVHGEEERSLTPVTPTDVQDVDLEETRTPDHLFNSSPEALVPLEVLYP